MEDLNIAIISFNCGREFVRPTILAHHIENQLTSPYPDIIVFSLQEIGPIAHSFLGGPFLKPYFSRFNDAVSLYSKQCGSTYRRLAASHVGMTANLVYIKTEFRERIDDVSIAGTGFGFHEMGNKGAVAIRLSLQTSGSDSARHLVFVAAHLAPAENAVSRRNEDWENAVRGLVFTDHGSSKSASQSTNEDDEQTALLEHEHEHTISGIYAHDTQLFVAGDLNYRTSNREPTSQDVASFPDPDSEPGSKRHYTTLLPKDQLSIEKKAGRTLQLLTETKVTFPPTYKLSDKQRQIASQSEDRVINNGTPLTVHETWKWASHRWPSWCDRILYLESPPSPLKVHKYTALPLMSTSDHRPVILSCTVSLARKSGNAAVVNESPFPLDEHWQSRRRAARRKEVIVGIVFYLGTTLEGRCILAATLLAILGGWALIRNFVS